MPLLEILSIVIGFAALLGAARVLGWAFERMQQPRLVGEIAAGVLLGPFIIGRWLPETQSASSGLSGFYWLGLLALMFLSGTEMRRLFARDNRREVAWLCGIGTLAPFAIMLLLAAWLPVSAIAHPEAPRVSVVMVLAIGTAVTSIPVITRIFHDLGILKTRFAGLILGTAALDDIFLWAVLAVATALASGAGVTFGAAAQHLAATLGFMALGFTVVPRVIRRLPQQASLLTALAILTGYVLAARWLQVDLVFAAFVAGYGIAGTKLVEALAPLRKVSFAVFIPVYFALIGQRLELGREFSLALFAVFLLGSSLLRMLAAGAASYAAGFRGLEPFNIAAALNARGGPGIVLAGIAFEAQIINAAFYTTLVLTAIVTSQAAGAWLIYVLRKGWPLLAEPVRVEKTAPAPVQVAA